METNNTHNDFNKSKTNPNSESKDNSPIIKRKWDNKTLLGIIVIFIGTAFLLEQLLPNFLPGWIFSWKTLLIAIGFIIGARRDFTGNLWWILVLIGILFLIDEILFSIDFVKPILFPIIIIAIGILIILRNRSNPYKRWTPPINNTSELQKTEQEYRYSNTVATKHSESFPQKVKLLDAEVSDVEQKENFHEADKNGGTKADTESHFSYDTGYDFREDIIQVNSFLGGNKRIVTSKKFKGGNATCILGSIEIDMVNADFEGVIYIDIFTAFGGMEISVPATWSVRNEIVSILGGTEDKRRYLKNENAQKTLVLKGTVILGGVEIKSY